MNKVDESINILEELVKKDAKKNLNDLVVQNLVNLYDIQYPTNPNEKKISLSEFCSKYSKDSVNSNIYVS